MTHYRPVYLDSKIKYARCLWTLKLGSIWEFPRKSGCFMDFRIWKLTTDASLEGDRGVEFWDFREKLNKQQKTYQL